MSGEDANYSKREIDMCFEQIKDKLDEIHEQVKTTNGRVTSLEKWRYGIAGGLSVLTILVLPILFSIISGWIK